MNRFGQILLVSLFLAFLVFMGLYQFMSQDYEISSFENRTLAQAPDLSVETVEDGSYMEQFEDYFADQFPGRNLWLKAYVNSRRLTNKTFVADHYITDDDWIIAQPTYEFLDDEIGVSTNKLNELARHLDNIGTELYYFSVPHKVSAMQFLYPDYIKPGTYLENIQTFMRNLDTGENFVAVDMTTDFIRDFSEDEIKELYFKTDHHWNMNGAFEGYKKVVETLTEHSDDFPDTKAKTEDYKQVCLSPSVEFEGSYNKQVYGMVDASEELKCFLLSRSIDYGEYDVYVNGQRKDPFEVYAKGYSENSSVTDYSSLSTDNIREIKITNEKNKAHDNKILIIKDSYANALIYQIAEHFYQTTIYDQRYNKDRKLMDYLDQHDFDIVIFVYNNTHLVGPNFNFDTVPVE